MNLCACEHNVPGSSFAERIAFLSELGVPGVELTIGDRGLLQGSLAPRVREIRQACERTGVRPTFITTQIRDLIDVDPARRSAACAQARDSLAAADEMGAVGITIVPRFGPIDLPDLTPFATPEAAAHALFVGVMRPLAEDADKRGLTIAIEPLNRYLAKFLTKILHARALCEEIGTGAMGILIDNFQSYYETVSIADAIVEAGPLLKHFHASDNTRRLPPQGSTDFRPIARALHDIAYDGYVSFECDVSGADLEREFVAAVEHMRAVAIA